MQVPLVANMTTEQGWPGYLGWVLAAAIFGMVGLIAYDKFWHLRADNALD